jgi:hypothetical protein
VLIRLAGEEGSNATKARLVRHVSLPTLHALSRNSEREPILINQSETLRVCRYRTILTFILRRTATLEDRMHHIETLIQNIPSTVFAAGVPPSSPTSSLVPTMFPDGTRSGVLPPSLQVFPLTNPSTHFTYDAKVDDRHNSRRNSINQLYGSSYFPSKNCDYSSDDRASLTASYLYFDDEGYTRWQGEASGLPLLDLLAERHTPAASAEQRDPATGMENPDWFPNRQPRRSDVDPQTFWRLITSYIAPKFMDRYGASLIAFLLK